MSKCNHVVGDAAVSARNRDLLSAECLSEPKCVGDTVPLLLVQLQATFRLDIERRPRRMQAVGEALGVAYQSSRARILADTDKEPIACRPGA